MNDDLLQRARTLTASAPKRELPSGASAIETARTYMREAKAGLDVYLAFDTTGSMDSYIDEVRSHIDEVTTPLLDGSADIRLSINGVGDHYDGANMLQLYAPTAKPAEVRGAMESIVMTNGGDEPEAYECLALALAQYIPTDSPTRRRAVVLIGDSVPHGMLDGPCERGVEYKRAFEALKVLTDGFYMVGCNPQMYAHQRALVDPAKPDREQFIPLGDMAEVLPALLVALAKKTESAASLNSYLKQLGGAQAEQIRGLLGRG